MNPNANNWLSDVLATPFRATKHVHSNQDDVYRIDLDTNADQTPLNPSDDLPTLEWVSLDKVSGYKLTPPSITLFKRLGFLHD